MLWPTRARHHHVGVPVRLSKDLPYARCTVKRRILLAEGERKLLRQAWQFGFEPGPSALTSDMHQSQVCPDRIMWTAQVHSVLLPSAAAQDSMLLAMSV